MKFSKSLLAAGMASLVASPASALEVEVGGQVNRAVMYVEDGYSSEASDGSGILGQGSDTEFYHVDNRNSPTRFTFGATQRLFEGWTAGAVIEIGAYANSSLDVSPAEKNTDAELDERITDAFVDSPYGKLTLGRGEGAAYNTARRDYSGTGVISFRHPGLIGGGLYYALKDSSVKTSFNADGSFRDRQNFTADELSTEEGAGRLNRTTIAGSIRDYNFEGRHERIRYDSPRIGPATVSVSAGNDGDTGSNSVLQVGVTSGLRVPGGRMLVGAGYSRATVNREAPSGSDDPDINTYGGSVSYFHSDTGLNLTFAAVNRAEELSEEEATGNFSSTRSELGQFRYAKLGYRPNRTHAFDIHYGETLNRNKDDEKGSVIGVGYVWSPVDMFDAYAGAKIHSFERGFWCTESGRTCYSPEYEDITIVTTGLRVKF
ncbi:porin [Marinobacter confluentis]|uniref:Porin n=1 Tax=Marinobacter confluentis TaxID=1697557 RepID=A0A4Z1BD74_9GAMM|nr:porin [Marinobacter confluentis]TGN40204.1 porin [Marinobacter confluentis]